MRDENFSRFITTAHTEGYFKDYYTAFRKTINESQFSEFSKLLTDEDRIRFVAMLLPACSNCVIEINHGKDAGQTAILKEKGNSEFVRGDTEKALESYTAALLKVPFQEGSSSELAILLANRSAASYHLEKFEQTIQDVELALAWQYPKELRFKALERKAKCLLALKRHDDALLAFRQTMSSLDDCKLPPEKKLKIQNNIQIMLNILTKPTTKQGRINAFVEGEKQQDCVEKILFPGRKNVMYPSIGEKVSILEGPDVGRYATANANIEAGETVAVEKSHCSVLLKEHASSHCLNCFKRLTAPLPCEGCSVAVFCGKTCKEKAMNAFHKYECSIASALYRSGASVTVIMALRIITQQPLQYFLDLKPSLQEPRENMKKYRSTDYLPVYHLVRHETQRPSEDFLERTAMAVFLLRSLQKVNYFHESESATPGPLRNDELFIGGLILRHLQLLQFNAHEIAELETDCTESLEKAQSIFIGGGLFPSLALFNHSCDAAVIRYFVGKSVVVRTIRNVENGDALAENYGPLFTSKAKPDRQKTLRSHYWFDCRCVACEEDWPSLNNMNRKVLRFRCNAGDEFRCNGVIEVAPDTTDFMAKCKICDRHTNILKGLKTLQDTDSMFRQATNDSTRGNFKAALDLYLEILRLLYQHLKPPFYDYHICQQAVRKCMLTLGNRYVKAV